MSRPNIVLNGKSSLNLLKVYGHNFDTVDFGIPCTGSFGDPIHCALIGSNVLKSNSASSDKVSSTLPVIDFQHLNSLSHSLVKGSFVFFGRKDFALFIVFAGHCQAGHCS